MEYYCRIFVLNEKSLKKKEIYFYRVINRTTLGIDFVSIIKGLLEMFESGFSVNLYIATL